MVNTSMSAAMIDAGINLRETRVSSALALFRNNGGTKERLLQLVDAAYALPDGGQTPPARDGQQHSAPVRQPDGDRAGQRGSGDDAQSNRARRSPPVEPSRAQRRMNAELGKVTVLTVFDTAKVRGRGSWGDVAVGELRAIMVDGTRDAAIAKILLRDIPIGTSSTKKVREVVTLSLFQRAMQKAAEVVDVEVGNVA